MNFVGYKVSINTLVNMQGSHEKMSGRIVFSSEKKNSQAIEIKCKILFSSHVKKEKWLLHWSLDLKTLSNPMYSDTFTATSGLKTQGKIERGEKGGK